MSGATRLHTAVAGEAALRLAFLEEEPDEQEGFRQAVGPFVAYHRTRNEDGTSEVEFQLSTFGLNWLFRPAYRRLLDGRGKLVAKLLPPQPLAASHLRLLGMMFWATAVIAYCGTLLGQTLAFAAPTLHAGPFAQALALGSARVDVLIALVLARIADTRGRAIMLRIGVGLAIAGTLAGALAPSIELLTIAEIIAKAGATTATLLIAVIISESVEQWARAWSLAFLVLGTSIGTGLCAVLVAGLSLNREAWRILFALAILGVPVLFALRRLADTNRFLSHPEPLAFRELAAPSHRRRLLLICLAAAMINVFYIPQSQFRNQFLRFDRHMPSYEISLFTIGTNLPGGIGLAVGGRQAETTGRRFIAVFGLVGGGLLLGLAFLSSGSLLIVLAALGAMIGTAAVPAMAVFGPELFPTRLRSGANAVATVASRVGSVAGLLVVGVAASHGLGYGTPIAMLAIFPIALAAIVWRAFPETRGATLEEINPEDAS